MTQSQPTSLQLVGDAPVEQEKALSSNRRAQSESAAIHEPEWSVIVITRNEERRIAQCLDAVCQAMRSRSHEIIVVDSNSTDETVRIAAQYPLTVVRLSATGRLTPAAGRHVGTTLARGALLLFVDGDSVLNPEWVDQALEALKDPSVAGVAGAREMVFSSQTDGRILARRVFPEDQNALSELTFLGGSAVYRSSVLREVGGFNPFLYACEEAELGSRIRKKGYTLLRLPIRMTEHLTESREETFRELSRRIRRGYPCGMGQLVRYGITNGTLAQEHLKAILRPVAHALIIVLGLVTVAAWPLTGRYELMVAWVATVAIATGVFCYRARSIRRPVYYACEWTVTGAMILQGLLMRPRAVEEYVRRVTVARSAPATEL